MSENTRLGIVQKDRSSYAVVPKIPLGILTAENLRKIADVIEKYNISVCQLTPTQRMALVGVKPEQIDDIFSDLGLEPMPSAPNCIRNVQVCPGSALCRYGQQDSLSLSKKLDSKFVGMDMPCKFKIGVSGCVRNCGESPVKDLGFVGKRNGWTVMVGGSAGLHQRFADEIADGLSEEEAVSLAEKVIDVVKTNAAQGERVGQLIDRIGLKKFKTLIENE